MKSILARVVRRLSYADRLVLLLWVVGLVASFIFGYLVYSESHRYSILLGEEYVTDEIYYVDTARRILENVTGIRLENSWPYSGDTRPDYLNLEHPPLGKYIIALSMLVCGDKPACWRLPGNIEAGLMPIILYLGFSWGARRAPRRTALTRLAAGLASAAALAADVSVRYEGSVALLDIHQAFFTALAIASLAAGSLEGFIIAASLAGAVKYSGYFVLPVAWLYIYLRVRDWGLRITYTLISILVPILFLLALSFPLMEYIGPIEWFKQGVIGAIGWHTTSRPPGPPTSTPLGWIFNVNPFYFSYQVIVGGETTTLLHIGSLLGGAAALVYYISRNKVAIGSSSYYSILGFYVLLYIIGNKTLYSFYVVQLAPAAAAVYGDLALAWLVSCNGDTCHSDRA